MNHLESSYSEEKRALLGQLLRSKAEQTKFYPLSFAQQRLWFLSQLEPDSSTYNISSALRVRGPFRFAVLEQTCNEIVRRHEVLRTKFAMLGGKPAQIVANVHRLKIKLVELHAFTNNGRFDLITKLATEDAKQVFRLAEGPMLRVTVFQCGRNDNVVAIHLHHIVSDGWSKTLFIRELVEAYEAFSAGCPSTMPELPIQYRDFAVWQRQWLSGPILAERLAYWKPLLADLPTLDLPLDHPRQVIRSSRGALQSIVFCETVADSLKRLSQREGATLFMTLLAAFQALIFRTTRQVDVAVGTVVANRTNAETERLIGFFANLLVLRTDLTGKPSFCALLGRVREMCLGAFTHQDLPFEKLVEEVQPARDLSRTPLFQVMFTLENSPESSLQIPGLYLEPVDIQSHDARYDMVLSLVNAPNGLVASLQYNADLFDDSTVTRLLGHFRNLVESAVANPEQHIDDLSLLNEAERHQVLVEWNDTQTDHSRTICLHQLFEDQVERSPDAISATFEDDQLTYRELNRRANQLAHCMQRMGVGPEIRVGVCLERSVAMLIGVLATLKAGGAYVPLDPENAAERTRFMLRDTQAVVLLTQHRFLQDISPQDAQSICLDSDWSTVAREGDANLDICVTADNLAYVMYTSGSTGKPKGVQISHGAVTNCLLSMRHVQGMASSDSLLAVTNLSFDMSVLELYLPIIQGARVVIASRETATDGTQLRRLLDRSPYTTMQATPATWRPLLDAGWQGIEQLNMICGGEALTRDLANELMIRGASLMNGYGPTEATVYSAVFFVDAKCGPVSIGKPIANTQLYLLDGQLNPVPIGIPSDLYIGGTGLARGYLNHPHLTAEKFIPDPLSHDVGARIYKTGDLCRHQLQGDIEYLGRIDHQVKIRGVRIELGEIEVVLSQHPAVNKCVVLARADETGERRLVAYVVPADDSPPTNSELRQFLLRKLTPYMVPSAFVTIPTFPLTPNGKLDRRGLPPPGSARPKLADEFTAPRTPVEELLAGIWVELLGVAQIGIHDNFFELGGHSLLATQVIARARASLQSDLSIRQLFESPTIAGLAECAERAIRANDSGAVLSRFVISRTSIIPLSLPQQRLWLFDQLVPNTPVYNLYSAVNIAGWLDASALHQALNALVSRHEILRSIYPAVEGQPVQLISNSAQPNLQVVDVREIAMAERGSIVLQLAAEEALRPFDLAQGPLVRFTLLQLDDQKHALLLTMHHIVSDAWSMGVLFRDFAKLYSSFADGVPSSLSTPKFQYADFANWQREWLRDEVLQQHLTYWKKQLEGASAILELPTDYQRPAVQSFRGEKQPLNIHKSAADDLQQLCRREGITLFMALLALIKAVLHIYSGHEDIIVITGMANRKWSETEDLVGFFINTLPLRTDLSGNPSFREIFRRIRKVCLDAYAHQDLPFEKIVSALQLERDPSRMPFYQVSFNLQNVPMPRVELAGLSITPIEIDAKVAKSDLAFVLEDTECGLKGALISDTGLFDSSTIVRMTRNFQLILNSVVAQPDVRLMDMVAAIADSEKQQSQQQVHEFKTSSRRKLGHVRRRTIRTSSPPGENGQ